LPKRFAGLPEPVRPCGIYTENWAIGIAYMFATVDGPKMAFEPSIRSVGRQSCRRTVNN